MVVRRRVLVSSRWLLHCLPLACGRHGSLREDDPLSCRSRVYLRGGCSLLFTLWVGLVCVPEGGVECDIQVITADEVVIIRNDMDDRRRVVRLGLSSGLLFTNKSATLLWTFARLEVWWIGD